MTQIAPATAPTIAPTTALDPRRREFYDRIAPHHMTPLWEVLHALVPPAPQSPAQPARWRYSELRPLLMEGGALLTAEQAERRVLILENPGMPGASSITKSLYAGLQLILPGEVAPAHRHAQSALRLVIEGEGAFTAVDGERIPMRPGDLILTPPGTWHDHGHEGTEPVVWMDGLDIPIVAAFDASYAEKGTWEQHPPTRPVGDNRVRYGRNLRPPVGAAGGETGPSRLMHYPYAEWRGALGELNGGNRLDPHEGVMLEFVDPDAGGSVLPTIAAFGQLVSAGFETRPLRRTDASIHLVCEGTGRATIGDTVLDLQKHDVIVAPSWLPFSLAGGDADLVLFSFSDRAAQQKLGLWREQRM